MSYSEAEFNAQCEYLRGLIQEQRERAEKAEAQISTLAQTSQVSREQIEKVLCCPNGCLRTDDCFVEGPERRWGRSKREREQADAILALCTTQTELRCPYCHEDILRPSVEPASQPPAAPVDLINRLRSMPSSLNDALRTMEEAADFLAGAPAAPVEGKTLVGAVADIRALAANGPMPAASVETGALDPLSMLLDAALYAQSIKPEWAKAARRAVATARAVQRSSAASEREDNTCYVNRSDVRCILLAQSTRDVPATEKMLRAIDALPIFVAADFRSEPQGAKVKPCGDADTCVCEIVGRTTCIHQPSESLQCLRCGTVDAFGPVSKEKK